MTRVCEANAHLCSAGLQSLGAGHAAPCRRPAPASPAHSAPGCCAQPRRGLASPSSQARLHHPSASGCAASQWQQGARCCQLVAAEMQGRGSDKQSCRAPYLDLLGPAAEALVAGLSQRSFRTAQRAGSPRACLSSCLRLLEPCAPLGRAHRGGAFLWAASWILWWSALSPSHCLFTQNHSVNAGLDLSGLGQAHS